MELFQGKAAQLVAFVSIVGTLAGFGYTGATYVNRIENLEKKNLELILKMKKKELVDVPPDYESLKELRRDIIEQEALHRKVTGLKEAYAQGFQTVSRVVSLRTFGGNNA